MSLILSKRNSHIAPEVALTQDLRHFGSQVDLKLLLPAQMLLAKTAEVLPAGGDAELAIACIESHAVIYDHVSKGTITHVYVRRRR